MKKQIEETVIKNGLLVSSKTIQTADIYISKGQISRIEAPDCKLPALKTIDAVGKFVLPGIIDAHLHPVYADRIDTLSQAAACEGITTMIPYIGAVKAWGGSGSVKRAINDFIIEGDDNSIIDFSLHCTLMQADLKEVSHTIPSLVKTGVTSFKVFMAYAKRGMKLEDREILKVMDVIANHGGLLAAHAENGDIIDYMETRFTAQQRETPGYHTRSHPSVCEAEAIFRLLALAEITGCPAYIPHISAAESLDVLRLFKEKGNVLFYTETCPHYLSLTEDVINKKGSIAKMAPPLRGKTDIDLLWQAVNNGIIDVIASDAAGNYQQVNEPLHDKIFDAPNGIPGLETLFKICYQKGVNEGRITLPRLVASLCENPAKIFGLYPKKGVLQPGSDADIVIVDPASSYIVPAKNRFLNVDYSLYQGWKGTGRPILTMLRGETICTEGELQGQAGQGEFVHAAGHHSLVKQ